MDSVSEDIPITAARPFESTPQTPVTRDAAQILAGGGIMGELMRAKEWASTPLGPLAAWPQSLRTVVSVCLSSRFPILIWWGPDFVKLYNDAYSEILGTKHPSALGRRGRDVWPEIWDIIGPMLDGVLTRGESTWSQDTMLPLQRKGFSEECYFTFSYSPIRDETGDIGGVFTAVSETTERVIGARRLITLRQLGEKPQVEIVDPAEECRLAARVLEQNPADIPFALVFLRDEDGEEKLVASSHIPIIARHGDEGARYAEAWKIAEVLEAGEPRKVEVIPEPFSGIACPWGESVTEAMVIPISKLGQQQSEGALVVGLSPRLPLDKQYLDFLNLVADQMASGIASARAYEAERRRAEALAELDREKTAFFSNVSHEFRTPLTLLLGPITDLLQKPASSEQFAQLELAHRNALRLLKLVNTLLDFARIEAGRATAQVEPTDIVSLTTDIASTFRSAIEDAGLALVMDAPDDIPPVDLDREMWEKIILNLVSNSYKHTFAGEIRIALRRMGETAVISVSDTGVGIPAEHLPRVFDRFHRVPQAKSRTYEGSGIGLSLVRELVHLQHGEIAVESRDDTGTTFRITMPLSHAHQLRRLEKTSVDGASSAYLLEALQWNNDNISGCGEKEDVRNALARILVADDNADMRAYITRLLESANYEVELATTGEEALSAIAKRRPDLLITDVMMPGIDGVELVHRLRSSDATKSLPVIMVSARAGEEARIGGLDAGADDYLVKPFAADELVAHVRAQIRIAQLSRAERIARDAAEKTRAQMSRIFSQAPVAIAVIDVPELRFSLANPLYQEMIGGRDPVGSTLTEVFPDLAGSKVEEIIRRVCETGEPFAASEFHARFDLERAGGPRDVWFDLVYHPLRQLDGSVNGIVAVATDVSDKVMRRQQVEDLRRVAEQASAAKSELLRTVSHETRQPVHASLGFLSMLEMGLRGPLTAEQVQDISNIRRNQEHLLALLNDILTFSRTEGGGLRLDISSIRADELIADLDPLVAPQFAAKGVEYSTRVESPDLAFCGDPERVVQICVNLVTNALKFTPEGGSVEVTAKRSGDFAEICVGDTGIGIPEDKLEQIFDPFTQLGKQLKTPTGGVGLGLAICRQLSQAMGGDVTVESTPGKGSTFTLRLPIA